MSTAKTNTQQKKETPQNQQLPIEYQKRHMLLLSDVEISAMQMILDSSNAPYQVVKMIGHVMTQIQELPIKPTAQVKQEPNRAARRKVSSSSKK